MLARNSVVRDARILKQADSLAMIGYRVTIVCLMDANCQESEFVRPSKVRIVRGDHRVALGVGVSVFRTLLTRVGPAVAKWPLGLVRPFLAALQELLTKARVKAARHIVNGLLAEMAVKQSPDILHCHDLDPLPAAIVAKRHLGCPLIFDAHEIYEDIAQGDAKLKARWRKMLKKAQSEIDGFITINDSIADFYAKNYRLPKATIVKNAAVRSPICAYDGRLHRAAGLPKRQRILLYQGGFAEKRGLRHLVEASAHLGDDWTLVMMGWGTLESVLRELAGQALAATSDHREIPCVAFVPPAPQMDLAHWSAGATVGTIPYERIGLNHLYCSPNKLWEYPNAGVPVLCSPLVELEKTVRQFGIGWLLPEEDLSPRTIAATVNNLQPADIERARSACASYMEREGWHKYERPLFALYTKLGFPPAPLPHADQRQAVPALRGCSTAESEAITVASAPRI